MLHRIRGEEAGPRRRSGEAPHADPTEGTPGRGVRADALRATRDRRGGRRVFERSALRIDLADPRQLCYTRRVRKRLVLLAIAMASCSSSQGRLSLVTGGESDVFSRSPAPTTLVVDAVDTTGARTNLATAKLPTTEIDLGELPRTNVASVQVTGKDDVGTVLVYGASVGIQFAVLEGATFPVFVQRTGEWARYPGALADGRPAPLLVATARALIVSGGSDEATAMQVTGYDVGTYAALTSITVTRAARSMAIVNASALLVDDTGATGLDLSAGTTFDVAVPTGGSYGDVAGGPTVYGEDGEAYIVGAGRAVGELTARVLKLDSAGKATFLTMGAPRRGAAVVWAKGRGLVVLGGSAQAPAGAELLPKAATQTIPLTFPSDPTEGASATMLNDTTVLVAGGKDGQGKPQATRTLDLTCAAPSCAVGTWKATPALALAPTQLFTTSATTALLIGDDAVGRDAHRPSRRSERDRAHDEAPAAARPSGARGHRLHRARGGGSGTLESYVP